MIIKSIIENIKNERMFKQVKNTLNDLNNYLFAEIERLDDESLTEDQLFKETRRAKAIANVSSQIISNANLQLKAIQTSLEYGNNDKAIKNSVFGIEENAEK